MSDQLDAAIKEMRRTERAKGVADAIRIIKGMGSDWPDAVNGARGRQLVYSVADDYARQFVSRILDQHPKAQEFIDYGSRPED
jgi:hypothetical protein